MSKSTAGLNSSTVAECCSDCIRESADNRRLVSTKKDQPPFSPIVSSQDDIPHTQPPRKQQPHSVRGQNMLGGVKRRKM
jgi:hypothetical protein